MKKLIGKKNLIMSAIALLLIAVMVAGVSYSWTEGGNKGNVHGNDIVISAGSSLTMRQDGKVTNSIIIPAGTLEETSSADGRNFFFPLVSNKENTTSDMVFREGIPADENKRYVSVDFELQAGDKETPVYLGAGTIIQCKNTAVLSALRMSFNLNNGTDPIVFKPNQMPGITEAVTYSPITAITGAGVATTGTTATEAYGDFYFKGENDSTPLFSLNKNETFNITLTLWLEGTEFSGNDISDSELSVFIDFTTTVDDLIKYNFIDNTHGYTLDVNKPTEYPEYWVSKNMEQDGVKYDTMMYIFDNDTNRYYSMEKTTDGGTTAPSTWSAYVPDTIKDFYFRRYSIDIDHWWNEWEPNMGGGILKDPNGEHTYVAICGNPNKNEGTDITGCFGYWKDQYGTFRIYFEMKAPFSELRCYTWDSNGDPCPTTGEWPGAEMTHIDDITDKNMYYIDLKETEDIAGIQFNNGGETRVYLENFNYGANTAAYVHFTDKDGNKKEPLGVWNNSVAGTKATYDASNSVGNYFVDFTVSQGNQDRAFYIIANNWNNGSQFPDSGSSGATGGKTGRVYRFTNGNTELVKLAGPYEVSTENGSLYKMNFNGACFWYENDSSNGFYVYNQPHDSLIYSFNNPNP